MSTRWQRLSGSRSLHLRFMVMVLAGALLLALAGGAAALYIGHKRALMISSGSNAALLAAVEKSLAVGAYAKDSTLLTELVEGMVHNELVKSVEVRAPGGALLARAGKPAADTVAGRDPVTERRLLSPFDAAETVATLQLTADGDFIGHLALREAAVFSGFTVVQVAVLAVLLYATAAWLVSGPIVRLARSFASMAPGTEQRFTKPRAHRHDEIGLLVDGANQLLEAHGNALLRERALRAEIEAMEAQYRQIFDSSSAGIFVLDAQYRLINSNPTVSRVVGMSAQRLREMRHVNFIEQVFGDPRQVLRLLQEASHSGTTVSGDLSLLSHDGQAARWVHCLISVQQPGGLAQPSARTVEGVMYDVTERRRVERRTRHRAAHDPLTGLKNRGATEAWLDRTLEETLQAGSSLTLMCLDLDGFKRVNDQFGHQAGDQVLVGCAKAMKAVVRNGIDLVGRIGGDEFFICLPHAGPGDALVERTALALIESLRRPFLLDDGTPVEIGVSIGIACLPLHGDERGTLAAAADGALYEVKRSGKNSYAMAASRQSPEPERNARATRTVAAALETDFSVSEH